MIQFAKKLVHHRKFIVFLAFILLIPSTIGIVKTRINYDILSYLPDSLETVKGQDIMVDQFGAGAYSMIIVEDMNLHDVQKLKQKLHHLITRWKQSHRCVRLLENSALSVACQG